jgi:8-oxo-dGTP pyrophosphatase MutT (NUDIX family)
MTINAVNILILNKENKKILCVKRSPTDEVFANMWALPGGGIEKGENDHDTAKREALEEINAEIVNLSVKPAISVTVPIKPGLELHLNVYSAQISTEAVLKSNTSDIVDVQWISMQQFFNSLNECGFPEKEAEVFKSYLNAALSN